MAIQTQRDDSSMNYAALAIPTAVTAWFVGWKPTWIKTLRFSLQFVRRIIDPVVG